MSEPRNTADSATPLDAIVRSALKGQYHGVLAMLRRAIELCPDDLWVSINPGGAPLWRVAYHTLYYTHLYLMRDEHSFTPWKWHQTGLQDLDGIPAPPELQDLLELPDRPRQTGVPYTREEILAYWDICERMVDADIDALDVLNPDTGFSWHTPRRSKVEQHIDSIRHIQHHTSQLAVRVRAATGDSVDWVASR